jgi:hypothetical protein
MIINKRNSFFTNSVAAFLDKDLDQLVLLLQKITLADGTANKTS